MLAQTLSHQGSNPRPHVLPEVASLTIRLFLAEDNDDLAALVTRRFNARQWSVVRASTAEEAASRLRGDRFDAVILDYQLPDGNGLDLLGIVRESSPATPVLFLTAHGSEAIALRALGLGASDYMQKSGTMLEDLPGRVESLLSREGDLRRASTVVTIPIQGPRTSHERHDAAPMLDADDAKAILKEFVKGDILGAAFFDGAGQPIAALLPGSIDPRALGISLVQVHAQAVLMGRTTQMTPRGYSFTLETEEGTLAATGIAGRALVAVLLDGTALRAAERLDALAQKLR